MQLPPVPDRDAARRALDLPLDAPVVAYVARLTRVKRPDRFAAMARRVAARRPDAMFLIAGDGELLAETQDRLKPLRSRVLFLGWRLDVACVYAAADVVVLTSDNEGFPVALIEAAMAGCPAVTTDVGSAAEAVAHGVTGLVCQTDPAELAAATLLLLDDPDLRRRLGHEARLRARRAFSRERMVEDAARLYHEVLATTR